MALFSNYSVRTNCCINDFKYVDFFTNPDTLIAKINSSSNKRFCFVLLLMSSLIQSVFVNVLSLRRTLHLVNLTGRGTVSRWQQGAQTNQQLAVPMKTSLRQVELSISMRRVREDHW